MGGLLKIENAVAYPGGKPSWDGRSGDGCSPGISFVPGCSCISTTKTELETRQDVHSFSNSAIIFEREERGELWLSQVLIDFM